MSDAMREALEALRGVCRGCPCESALKAVDTAVAALAAATPGEAVRMFPVLIGYGRGRPKNVPVAVPWAWLARFEHQALYNHCGQTLEQLAKRGGLSPAELWAVAHGKDWSGMEAPCTDEEACAWLNSEPWTRPTPTPETVERVAKALEVWRRHAEDDEEWLTIRRLEKDLAAARTQRLGWDT